MEEHKLDVLFLTETKSTSYYSYLSEQYLVILSGNHKQKHAGVGAIVSPKLRPHLLDVLQVSPRLIHLCFKQCSGNVHLLGAYGPHSGLDLEEEKLPFWDSIEDQLSKIPKPEPVYITGDFNVRFQARHRNDEGVTGPFVYGKGSRYIDHNANSNRSLCIGAMQRLDMLEVASYKTPNPMHQITYRDKTAPPKDWSQFLLDPLIMQQVYDVFHSNLGEAALSTAATVRSYLSMESLLPAPKIPPHPDPVYFQRLDHTFTRRQWLNTVQKCRSKLYTGYPSDHHLLVTDIKVKLAAKPMRNPRPPQLDIQVNEDSSRTYNAILRDLWESPIDPDHNSSNAREGYRGTIFTDGSGSRGRCTKHTPAGWGWCSQNNDGEWIEAFGPVITDPDHMHFRGAQVGSNNTGELTAILEAILYSHEFNWSTLTIRSDSLWSINVITGKWKARRHKILVNYVKALIKASPTRIHLQWIKAHVGHEGNERADRLAEEGKNSLGRFGTTAPSVDVREVNESQDISGDPAAHMLEASKQTFCKRTIRPRRPWITQPTLEALQDARKAEADQDHNAKSLRNQAKRLAKKDRIRWIHAQLTKDPGQYQQNMWNVAKNQKKGFQGRKRHLVVDNKPIPWSQTQGPV